MQRDDAGVVMLQIRHVPDDVHQTLKDRAASAGMSLADDALADLTKVRRLTAAGVMTAHRAAGAVADLQALPVVSHDPTELLTRTWELRENATPDERPLVTADRRLARSPATGWRSSPSERHAPRGGGG